MGNGVRFGVHNNSLVNLQRGILERVFYVERDGRLQPPLRPKPGVFKELNKVRSKLCWLVGPHSPIPRSEYPGLYTGRRKTIYQNALESLTTRGVERKDSFLKTFVKAEKINFSAKVDPAPRVIQPRDVRYNLEVGRYLKCYEHHLYRGIDKLWKGPTVIKGYTCEEIGDIMHAAWGEFQKPVAIGFDMSRFDQHVSVEALQFEHSVYMKAFKSPELDQLLSWQLHNKGTGVTTDGKVKYHVHGRRMSGDINTAMGNCLLACLITKHLMEGIRARLLNNGDDCVLIIDASDAKETRERMSRWSDFGFKCVLEEDVTTLEKVEFCKLHPVFDGEKWLAVRNPHESLAKDTYSIGTWNSTEAAQKWLRAIGECGLALTGGLPLLQAYYSVYTRTCNVKTKCANSLQIDSGFWRLSQRMKRKLAPVSEECRISFYRAFGIPPAEQVALEEFYDAMDPNYSQAGLGNQWTQDHQNPLYLVSWQKQNSL